MTARVAEATGPVLTRKADAVARLIFVAGGALVGGILASLGVEFAFEELTE
jgi:hypothetical protein